MRGAVLYGPRDVRYVEREAPTVVEPTYALIRIAVTCVCGSDLWDYRGIHPVPQPKSMGHEYCGIVEEVGGAVTTIKPGQFVVGSFFASDNACPICQAGYQSRCVHNEYVGAGGAQAPLLRVPLADGTLVATPATPPDDLLPSLLATSDVLGTGWFGADAAAVGPGKTVAGVGDGAVGLCAVLAAHQLGAERIIAMSRHAARQELARGFGATDVVTEGVGLAQRRGGPIEVIRPGDRMFFELGEDYWHGAAPTRFMTHLALQQVDEAGNASTWGTHVTDAEYGTAPPIDA